MNDPEPTLVARAVAGDADALSTLLEEHGPAIQQRLKIGKQWRSMLEPEDVMQVTYLEAFIEIGRFDPKRGPFANWLGHIAENNLRDALRGLQRQKQPQPNRRMHMPDSAESFVGLLEMLGATTTTPSRVAGRDEAQRLLEAAIDRLPDDYAQAIRLYDLQGLDMAEVARRMSRSTGAIHMLRARAHDRLRTALGTESMFFSAPA